MRNRLGVLVWTAAVVSSGVAVAAPSTPELRERPTVREPLLRPRPLPIPIPAPTTTTTGTAPAPAPSTPAPTVKKAPFPVPTDYISRFDAKGALDPTFGSGSWTQTASPTHHLAIDKSDRVVTFGAWQPGGSVPQITIGRHLVDGAKDSAFGTNGAVAFPIGATFGNAARPRGVEIDGGGRIVACVDAVSPAGGYDPTIFRVMDSGVPDSTFGTAGKVVVKHAGAGAVNESRCAVDAQGRILVASASGTKIHVSRLTPMGALDPAFAPLPIDFGARTFTPSRVALDDKGRVYVVANELGPSMPSSGNFLRFSSASTVRRLLPSGALDTAFAPEVKDVALSDGVVFRDGSGLHVALAGWSAGVAAGPANDLYATQIDENGAVETTFGQQGVFRARPTNLSLASYVSRILRTSKGQLILIGMGMNGGMYEAAFRRLDNRGALDTTFGSGGAVQMQFGDPRAAVLDTQGRIVVRGAS